MNCNLNLYTQGSLTGVPIGEIVEEVEALLNHDLGRSEGNQVLTFFLINLLKIRRSNPHK